MEDVDTNQRFSSTTNEKMQEMQDDIHSRRTKNATTAAMTDGASCREYCREKRMDANFDKMPKAELALLLKEFHTNARRVNGEDYSI